MRGIAKRYPGVVANDDVDFDLGKGEIVGLLGENGAGKTTLMKILYGLESRDAGTIEIDGEKVNIHSPHQALRHGIGMVHQHFMLVPNMTAAENVALGLGSTITPRLDLRRVRRGLRDLSDQFGLELDPDSNIEDLAVGQQQLVEILKLLYREAQLLILDEPTASLTPLEWTKLRDILKSLAADGSSIVFITHKLDEIFEIADRVTVLRDGRVVGNVAVVDTTKADLARMMVGRDVVLRIERPDNKPGEPVLDVRDLRYVDDVGRKRLDGIDFEVRAGEVFGVAGVDGNGQAELVGVLTGLLDPDTASIRIGDEEAHGMSPLARDRQAAAVVPQDRHRDGVALELSLSDNLMMRDYGIEPFSRHGIQDFQRTREHTRRLVDDFDIRAPSTEVRMAQLSGGNQQKTVLARELSGAPSLLIAAHPTRGLDVGAMEFVYRRILEHRAAGGATLLISNELEEIMSLSDRIAVMVRGRFIDVVDAAEADLDRIGLLIGGEAVGKS